MTLNDIENTLKGLGYTLKRVTGSRVAIVTDKRQAAINHVMEIFKNDKPQLTRDDSALRISSLGVVKVDRFQIIAKPATKNVLKAEQEATESLIKLIRDACDQEGKAIDIQIGRYTLKNCNDAGSDQIKGDPKADIAILDDKGKEVGFISHKKEGGAKAFQQYGGISRSAGDNIYNDKMVQDFVKDLREQMQLYFGADRAKSGFSAFRYVPNTRQGQILVSRSVYGPDWAEGRKLNRQSVHCIGQGSPILTRQSNGSYKLTFSESTHFANEHTWAFQGDYKAVLAATYRAGRKVESGGITLLDVRGGIYPYDFIKSRKKVEI
tara:strand:+ start:1398 stop:2363 length:966 start_codon:yes stop_codon:yes gene_type:complete